MARVLAVLHALFDAGYVTVTPSLELRVSRRIREEFLNGRDYYALEGASVRVPLPPAPPLSAPAHIRRSRRYCGEDRRDGPSLVGSARDE